MNESRASLATHLGIRKLAAWDKLAAAHAREIATLPYCRDLPPGTVMVSCQGHPDDPEPPACPCPTCGALHGHTPDCEREG